MKKSRRVLVTKQFATNSPTLSAVDSSLFCFLILVQRNQTILFSYSILSGRDQQNGRTSRYFNVSLGSDWSDTNYSSRMSWLSTGSLDYLRTPYFWTELTQFQNGHPVLNIVTTTKYSIFIRDFLNCTRYISLYNTSIWFLCIACTEMVSSAPSSPQ